MAVGRFRVRLWLIAVLLFGAGFCCRIVLATSTDPSAGYITAMAYQLYFYGAGWLVLFVWNWTAEDALRGLLGCGGLIIVAVICLFLIASSSPK